MPGSQEAVNQNYVRSDLARFTGRHRFTRIELSAREDRAIPLQAFVPALRVSYERREIYWFVT